MNPIQLKVLMLAIDQAGRWIDVWRRSAERPNMTEAEANDLIQATNAEALAVSSAWRASRGTE